MRYPMVPYTRNRTAASQNDSSEALIRCPVGMTRSKKAVCAQKPRVSCQRRLCFYLYSSAAARV
jgi:hypothetical protein